MKYLALIVLLVASVLQVPALATDFPIVGKQAPAFDLPDLSGAQHSLSDYIGHPIVINFWTTWCGACAYEFPVLEQFKQKYADQVSLITICAGNSQDKARSEVEKKGVDFLVLYDEAELIAKAYQPPRPRDKRRIVAFPFSVFIDETGTVVYARIGTFTDLDKMVSLLHYAGITLTEPTPPPSSNVPPIRHEPRGDGE